MPTKTTTDSARSRDCHGASPAKMNEKSALVARARDGARVAGCEYLHVDFEDRLRPFYLGACGFTPTSAGLLKLD